MATLMMPLFERRLLLTVREEVAAEPVRQWHPRSLKLCLRFLRGIRESAAEMRQALQEELANGVEARSFARTYTPLLPAAADHLVLVGELVEELSSSPDPESASLAAELRLLQQENEAFHELLSGVLSRASEPPRPANWERVRAAEEAHALGQTKP